MCPSFDPRMGPQRISIEFATTAPELRVLLP
jgi:hypothetical protein